MILVYLLAALALVLGSVKLFRSTVCDDFEAEHARLLERQRRNLALAKYGNHRAERERYEPRREQR